MFFVEPVNVFERIEDFEERVFFKWMTPCDDLNLFLQLSVPASDIALIVLSAVT